MSTNRENLKVCPSHFPGEGKSHLEGMTIGVNKTVGDGV